MPIFPLLAAFLGGAVLSDLFGGGDTTASDDAYGYGEGALARVPVRIWKEGAWGLRGRPRNWRSPNYGGDRPGTVDLGVRAPTASWRHPLPRPWEVLEADDLNEFGMLTGAGGIRGVPTFQSFTPAQQAAYRLDGAAQGLRAVSVAPSGS